MSTRELIDEVEWKANLEYVNKSSKRFHMKSMLHPAPWIVRKEYLDRIGVQTMKNNKLLDAHFKTLKDSDYWEWKTRFECLCYDIFIYDTVSLLLFIDEFLLQDKMFKEKKMWANWQYNQAEANLWKETFQNVKKETIESFAEGGEWSDSERKMIIKFWGRNKKSCD